MRLQVAMCGCEPILLKLAMCVRAVLFQTYNVRLQLCKFFGNNVSYEDKNALSLGVYYNSVAQKLRFLAI